VTVKAKRGRRRYVAFRVADGLTHEEGVQALHRLHQAGIGGLKVIQYEAGKGIIRCGEPEKDRTIAAMRALAIIVPLRTSGTLRTLREEFFPEGKR
jgi:RNase P/RNase MRP subunit POP5